MALRPYKPYSIGRNLQPLVSLNGVFVDGVRVAKGEVVDVCVGDEVSLGCGSQGSVVWGWIDLFAKGCLCSEVVDRNIVGNDLLPTDCAPAGISRNGINANGTEEALSLGFMSKKVVGQLDDTAKENNRTGVVPPPGKKFVLNRLASEGPPNFSEDPNAVSLPELLYPIENLEQLFIATFTADIPWQRSTNGSFLIGFCPTVRFQLIYLLPSLATMLKGVWSSNPDKRSSTPYPDFPNLIVSYPPFPEVISIWSRLRGNQALAAIIQSCLCCKGKIVSVLWSHLLIYVRTVVQRTNTVWWQDFAWMPIGSLELTNYDFRGSAGYLVASVPGVHSSRIPCVSKPKHFLGSYVTLSQWGSVEASVADVYGMSEVILKRDSNIPADANAVSILVPNPEDLSLGEFVQLGFLPKNYAKWVAPLSDSGLFVFSAYIFPSEVLSAALEGSSSKVQLILHVSQGPSFSAISEIIRAEHVSAICSLIASLQRCWGIWRLQEVLSQFKWPEHLETDFVFGSSSIGSINAKFLAAFSAAAGKRSSRFFESEESDPDWGCWSVSQELRNPSIRIIFPTIERVKSASSGILASRRILCFSQKTWHRLKTMGILHDAVPYPGDRIGNPMHVKVARRRFQLRKDASSFGWVYCGSHNFSEAAWGRPVSGLLDKKINGNKSYSNLGSRLHISNYELGILFITPPPDAEGKKNQRTNLDDIVLPFVMPAPKYRPADKPATPQEMREALMEQMECRRDVCEAAKEADEWMQEEIPEEEEVIEATDFVVKEKEDEKAYAEKLWSQVDSSENC
ncbi:hypothetical protein HAX54_037425 [Datura stramonium]|uniref:HIRAN domain-containing protein n=1 Tax=Datura stramonium TaxID=4076 RepID=A0ABS8SH79_DATST|nr:hypothetical protein [Datura stramonium]